MKVNIWYVVLIFVVLFAVLKQCEGEPRVITKTEVNISEIIDSVKQATLKDVKTVYIDTSKSSIKYVKGKTIYKDSIIYQDKPSETTITANQFETELKANKALAKLKITTTGQLLDVSGVITYPEKENITTITKIKDKSGLYIFGAMPINNFASPELGVLFQIRNKMFVSTSAQFNNITKQPDFKIGVGVKIW